MMILLIKSTSQTISATKGGNILEYVLKVEALTKISMYHCFCEDYPGLELLLLQKERRADTGCIVRVAA